MNVEVCEMCRFDTHGYPFNYLQKSEGEQDMIVRIFLIHPPPFPIHHVEGIVIAQYFTAA